MIPQTSKSSFARTDTVSQTSTPENTQVSAETCETPSTSSSEVTGQPANASAPATEQKGYMEMGAEMMKDSLNRALETGKSFRDNIYEGIPQHPGSKGTASKEVSTGECELPAPPSSAQDVAKVDTTKMTESQKFDHYKNLTELGGGTFNSEAGARNIVGIRNPTAIDAGKLDPKTLNSKGVYDDTLAVLWQEKDGTKRVEEFKKATVDPARKFTETSSQDVNKDGNRDGGRLLPGFYKYEVSTRDVETKDGTKQEPALRPTEDVPVERDLNGDGFFNDGHDDKKSGKTILIHTGYNSETGSAGCQTIHKEDWNRFLESFPEDIANKNDIGYTLVQVGD